MENQATSYEDNIKRYEALLKELKEKHAELALKLMDLDGEATSMSKPEVAYPIPLIKLFNHAHPEEWHENVGEIIDTLIFTMKTNEDYYYGDVLHSLRSLEKFFFSLSAYAELDVCPMKKREMRARSLFPHVFD